MKQIFMCLQRLEYELRKRGIHETDIYVSTTVGI